MCIRDRLEGAGHLEIIVIDDGSTDHTVKELNRYTQEHGTSQIRLLRHTINPVSYTHLTLPTSDLV